MLRYASVTQRAVNECGFGFYFCTRLRYTFIVMLAAIAYGFGAYVFNILRYPSVTKRTVIDCGSSAYFCTRLRYTFVAKLAVIEYGCEFYSVKRDIDPVRFSSVYGDDLICDTYLGDLAADAADPAQSIQDSAEPDGRQHNFG